MIGCCLSKTTLDICPHQLCELWAGRTRLPVLFVCFSVLSSLARGSKCSQQLCWTESPVHCGQTNPTCFLYWGNWGAAFRMFTSNPNLSYCCLAIDTMAGYFRTCQDVAFPPSTLHSPLKSLNLLPWLKKCPIIMYLPPPALVFGLRSQHWHQLWAI